MKRMIVGICTLALSSTAFAWAKVCIKGDFQAGNNWKNHIELVDSKRIYDTGQNDTCQNDTGQKTGQKERRIWEVKNVDMKNGDEFKFVFGDCNKWDDGAPIGYGNNLHVSSSGPYKIEIVDNKLPGDKVRAHYTNGEEKTTVCIPYDK